LVGGSGLDGVSGLGGGTGAFGGVFGGRGCASRRGSASDGTPGGAVCSFGGAAGITACCRFCPVSSGDGLSLLRAVLGLFFSVGLGAGASGGTLAFAGLSFVFFRSAGPGSVLGRAALSRA
jgi:hypothetical protein